MSSNSSAFSAQVITVRGLITVDTSPLMNPERVSSASATMALTVLRPASLSYDGTFAITISTSASWPR